MESLKIIGKNIRFFRKLRGMTQEQLSEATGLNRTYIGFAERGTRNLSVKTLEIFAEAFQVPVHILFTPDIEAWYKPDAFKHLKAKPPIKKRPKI